jgi:YVTN family beta-propeller protein
MTPDGRFGYVPERDQDTVMMFDVAERQVVKRVSFPKGSKPFMNRVTPDGSALWVQTAVTHMNYVLDTATLDVISATSVAPDPEQSAFQPGGPYALIMHLEAPVIEVLETATNTIVKQIEPGANSANACFTPDGGTAFVSSPSGNSVLVLDMTLLEVIDRIPVSPAPQGLVLIET